MHIFNSSIYASFARLLSQETYEILEDTTNSVVCYLLILSLTITQNDLAMLDRILSIYDGLLCVFVWVAQNIKCGEASGYTISYTACARLIY